jgi:hypothetical protein
VSTFLTSAAARPCPSWLSELDLPFLLPTVAPFATLPSATLPSNGAVLGTADALFGAGVPARRSRQAQEQANQQVRTQVQADYRTMQITRDHTVTFVAVKHSRPPRGVPR